jgi:ribosome-binding protein aMBF1 (putative translation factor)
MLYLWLYFNNKYSICIAYVIKGGLGMHNAEHESKSELLGDTLRREIRNAGFKQADFAKMLEISPSRLSNYINGTRTPDIFILSSMADLLGVSLDSICRRDTVRVSHFPRRYTLTVYEGGTVRLKQV